MLSHRSVDGVDPAAPEGPSLDPPVPVGVLLRLLDSAQGHTEHIFPCAPESLCEFEDLLATPISH